MQKWYFVANIVAILALSGCATYPNSQSVNPGASTTQNGRAPNSKHSPINTFEFVDWEAVALVPKKSAVSLLQRTANGIAYPRCDVRSEQISRIEQRVVLPPASYSNSIASAVWLRGDRAKGGRMYRIIMVLPGMKNCRQVSHADLANRACIVHLEGSSGPPSSKYGSVLTALASLGTEICTFDYTHRELVYR